MGNSNEVFAEGSSAAPTNGTVHVAVAIDSSDISLFRGDSLVDSTSMTSSLSALVDDSNWLGRSQFAQDPGFTGTVHEFRIYDSALTEPQVELSDTLGPDAALGSN
jgi:hypothetical protein